MLLFEQQKNVCLQIYFGKKAWLKLVKDPLLNDNQPYYYNIFLDEVYHKHLNEHPFLFYLKYLKVKIIIKSND